MTQLTLLDKYEEVEEIVPDEVSTEGDYVISLYLPKKRHFNHWLQRVNETLLDMTGYSVHDFAVVPTYSSWMDDQWPDHAIDAARSVLSQDLWGQAFLGDLDLE